MRRIGIILLAVWLVLTGLIALFKLHFGSEGVILGILALAAGVLLLIEDTGGKGRGRFRFAVGPGMLLLAIYLILVGLLTLFGIHFTYEDVILGLLALAAGVILLIGR